MDIPEKMKRLRKLVGKTQGEVATALGIKQGFLSQLEVGKRALSPYIAILIEYSFGLVPESLRADSKGLLFKDPLSALKALQKAGGLDNVPDILFLLYNVQEVYAACHELDVTTSYVLRLLEALEYLVGALGEKGIAKESINYIAKNLHTSPKESEIIRAINSLSSKFKAEGVSGLHGEIVTSCVISALSDTNFELKKDHINKLASILTPWIFWVSVQISSKTYVRVDTSILDRVPRQTGKKADDRALKPISHGNVSLLFYPDKGTGMLTIEGSPKVSLLTINISSLYELIFCLSNYVDTVIFSGKEWEIFTEKENKIYTVQYKKDTFLALREEDFERIKAVVVELKKNEKFFHFLTSQYLEEYGTI